MPQKNVWEKEYNKNLLVNKNEKPQNFLIQFIKYLKKKEGFITSDLSVLDLGCGTGRNSNYLAEKGNDVFGVDIAKNAINIAEHRARKNKLSGSVSYIIQSIGDALPFDNNYFDLILDITSSNSLNEKERAVYIKEIYRTLKPGGFVIVRALCKDGDKNAKKLLENNPGREKDTYFLKELGLVERVFSEVDLRDLYSNFIFRKLVKDMGLPKINGKIYKRKYWLLILKKPE